MLSKKILFLFIVILIVSSCDPAADPEKGEVVAKVSGNYLYESDISGIVASGTPRKDSTFIINNYIDNSNDCCYIV